MTPVSVCAAVYTKRARPIRAIANDTGADPDEIARAAGIALSYGWVSVAGDIIEITPRGREAIGCAIRNAKRRAEAKRMHSPITRKDGYGATRASVLEYVAANPDASTEEVGLATMAHCRAPREAAFVHLRALEAQGLITRRVLSVKGRPGAPKVARFTATELAKTRVTPWQRQQAPQEASA